MENPEKIEIEGLKTIHKLCNFGADHNMEGCTFTEIVERMFSKIEQMKTQVNTLDEMLLNQGEVLAQAKAQAVPEPVLDAPACVGAGTFQKGVKWSTVISAAQRHYKNDGHHERPAVSVADQLRIASGHSVVVPREPTELMIRAACGSDDVNEMALLEQQYKQMIEAAREQKG